MLLVLLFNCFLSFGLATSSDCKRRVFENGTVCVCNSTYCDTIPQLEITSQDDISIFSTSNTEPGFNSRKAYFDKANDNHTRVISLEGTKYQEIIGFGGAFTDSTGYIIKQLPEDAQLRLLKSYFSEEGIGYSLCRTPIGGADFSPRAYSYDDDEGDEDLKSFSIQPEDFFYKIPLMKAAKALRGGKPFKLVASPWTAPRWMKTIKVWSGYSMLKPEYYQLFVDYIIAFLDEYKKCGIDIWGLTTGNEPLNGFRTTSEMRINSMGWIPELQSKWIREDFGPGLKKSVHKDVKIISHDDDRLTIPHVVPQLLSNNETLKYTDGVGVHWYWDDSVPPEVMELAKTDQKDIFLLSTEACYFLAGVSLGDWSRGAGYAKSIIEYLKFGFAGWIDWNMALNLEGGPTYIDYVADSPIIVNETSGEFYKQPMFYVMGHFSKFVIPGSIRLGVEQNFDSGDEFQFVAFLRPDDLVAVVVLNNGSNETSFRIKNGCRSSSIIKVEGNSISTILYQADQNQ
ncbi:hypothetical protein JTB14_007927 [Gonioctena quinquepunctata]|nr:hypothetical protein JTB14_007927 [Gonioctena quinquepunctata]